MSAVDPELARQIREKALRLGLEAGVLPAADGMPVYVIPLGYTRPPLSLNDRGHWRTKAKKTRELRTRVAWRARQVKVAAVPHIHVALTWVPPDRRHRDADNLVATLKPAIDALTGAGQARGWPCTPMVPDDTPEHVTWSPPTIAEPDAHGPRLCLFVHALLSPPRDAAAYGALDPTD